MCLQGAYRSWSPPLVKVVSCEPRLANQRLAEFVNNESTRKALSFFQISKNKLCENKFFQLSFTCICFRNYRREFFRSEGAAEFLPPPTCGREIQSRFCQILFPRK